jgi:Lantibiotic biosynthesis dehydratase C-term
VTPLLARIDDANMADEWFFIRYADPGTHLRLRWRQRTGAGPAIDALVFLSGVGENTQQVKLTRRLGEIGADWLPEQVGGLFHHGIDEGGPVILAFVAGGDQKRHYLHTRRRVQHEP